MCYWTGLVSTVASSRLVAASEAKELREAHEWVPACLEGLFDLFGGLLVSSLGILPHFKKDRCASERRKRSDWNGFVFFVDVFFYINEAKVTSESSLESTLEALL